MAYTTTLTNGGKAMLQAALMDEGRIIFTNLMIGSGNPPADPSARTALVNPVVSAPITSITRGSGYFARVVATLYNTDVLVRFNVTELGLYAKDGDNAVPILYAYVGITEGDGGSVPPGANVLIERQYTINVYVDNAQDVAADVDSSEAATKAELNAHNNSSTAHENRFVTKQDRTDLLTAAGNLSLTDNDVFPVYTSGKLHRKFSVGTLFNYIKTKYTLTANDLPLIPANKGGTGRTTLTQYSTLVGNGTGAVTMVAATKGAYYVSANNTLPKYGTLPVDVGGSGRNTLTANATLVGNGTGAVKMIPSAVGAYYASTVNGEPVFGTLPVNGGGTGRNTLTAHAVLLGNGTSAVTMKASKAGAFFSTGATADPDFGVLPIAYGGTGNSTGYVRAGLASGVSAGSRATAEGTSTSSTGDNSHAEGNATTSFGNNSHAEGLGTVANSRAQHVVGEYNIADTQNKTGRGTYAEIVGNGTSSARSNARTLSWSGDETLAGGLFPMADNAKDIGSSTKRWKNIFAAVLNGALAKKVTFNSNGSGAASGTAFNGGSDVVVSYNTVGAAAATHNHTPAQITTDGALGAYVSAKANTPLGSARVRNIYAGTADMTPGTSALAFGTIYLVYQN